MAELETLQKIEQLFAATNARAGAMQNMQAAMEAQNGQQPDNMPPAQPGEKNGQEAGMTMPGDNMPQEQPSAMSGTAAPPAMPAPDTFGQR